MTRARKVSTIKASCSPELRGLLRALAYAAGHHSEAAMLRALVSDAARAHRVHSAADANHPCYVCAALSAHVPELDDGAQLAVLGSGRLKLARGIDADRDARARLGPNSRERGAAALASLRAERGIKPEISP